MAELLSLEDLSGSRLDTQILKEAVNEDKMITARFGREYASLPMASRLLVENGLLGARPFSTYAKMTAPDVDPPLVDGDYAIVTNDLDLFASGVYKKIAGVWVYQNINTAQNAVKFTVTGKNFVRYGYDENGTTVASKKGVMTDSYKLPAGTVLKVNRLAGEQYWAYAVSDSPTKFDRSAWKFEVAETITITSDKPYIRFYARNQDGTTDVDLVSVQNSSFKVTSSLSAVAINTNAVTQGFMLKSIKNTDFKVGVYDGVGYEQINDKYAQTYAIRLPDGAVSFTVTIKTSGYLWAYASSEFNNKFTRSNRYAELTKTISVPANHKYAKFYLSKTTDTAITASDLALLDIDITLNITNDDYKTLGAADILEGKTLSLSVSDFEMMPVDNSGQLSKKHAQTNRIYKLPPGSEITVAYNQPNPLFYYSYGTADNPTSVKRNNTFFAEPSKSIVVTEQNRYIRFYVELRDKSEFDIKTITDAQLGFTAKLTNQLLRMSDLADLYAAMQTQQATSARMLEFSSNKRYPADAIGGVVTFIDDDGRAGLYSELYPVVKQFEIPYGFAVSPGMINTAGYITKTQLTAMAGQEYVEIQSHSWSHGRLTDLTDAEVRHQVAGARDWFAANGFAVDSFVYPYGADDARSKRLVSQYYAAAYDFNAFETVNFDNIDNQLIVRCRLSREGDMAQIKPLIDAAATTNAWLIITTHAGNEELSSTGVWWEIGKTVNEVVELFNYAKIKGCKVLKPRDAFNIFGNIAENGSGFKIQANGVIKGSTSAP